MMKSFLFFSCFLLAVLLLFLTGCRALQDARTSTTTYEGSGPLQGIVRNFVVVVAKLFPCTGAYEARHAAVFITPWCWESWTSVLPELKCSVKEVTLLKQVCQ